MGVALGLALGFRVRVRARVRVNPCGSSPEMESPGDGFSDGFPRWEGLPTRGGVVHLRWSKSGSPKLNSKLRATLSGESGGESEEPARVKVRARARVRVARTKVRVRVRSSCRSTLRDG